MRFPFVIEENHIFITFRTNKRWNADMARLMADAEYLFRTLPPVAHLHCCLYCFNYSIYFVQTAKAGTNNLAYAEYTGCVVYSGQHYRSSHLRSHQPWLCSRGMGMLCTWACISWSPMSPLCCEAVLSKKNDTKTNLWNVSRAWVRKQRRRYTDVLGELYHPTVHW